jgi:hypothetical protein
MQANLLTFNLVPPAAMSESPAAAPGSDVSGSFLISNDLIQDPVALQRRYRREGYLFFRGLLPRQEVLEVRRAAVEAAAAEGWLRPGTDPMLGLTDHTPVAEGEKAWIPVYERLQRAECFHRLKLNAQVRQIVEILLDEPAWALPMTIARISFPRDNGRQTQPHQDWLYVQGSLDTISCWAPLGDVPQEVGGLKILAGSHKAGILIPRAAQGPGGNVVPCDPTLPWVASDFQAGDLLMFNALTVHGARANFTPDRLRLSMDFRWTGMSCSAIESWMKPHFHWLGPTFQWDSLDRDWQDAELRRYWERLPGLKVRPDTERVIPKS